MQHQQSLDGLPHTTKGRMSGCQGAAAQCHKFEKHKGEVVEFDVGAQIRTVLFVVPLALHQAQYHLGMGVGMGKSRQE